MTSYKIEQHRVTYGGRSFHFVSYDGAPANERRGLPAVPAMWYLMGPAKRWAVIPQVAGQSDEEITAALLAWIEEQGFDPISIPRKAPVPPVSRRA